MAQDLGGLQAELHTMKQELLDAVAGVAGSVVGLRKDFERIEAALREVDRKVQYMSDELLGRDDHAVLRRAAASKR